jgi:hypothetical protein
MDRLGPGFLIPVGVTIVVALIISGIGNLLLFVREASGGSALVPVWVALGLALIVLIACSYLASQNPPGGQRRPR